MSHNVDHQEHGVFLRCAALYIPIKVSKVHMVASVMIFALSACFIISTNFVLVYGLIKKRVWKLRSTRLFLFLIVSDLLVGIVSVPLVIGILLAPVFQYFGNCNYVFLTNIFLEFPSLLSATTVLMIAADRFFAVKKKRLHVRYATTRVFLFLLSSNVCCAMLWSVVTYYSLVSNIIGQSVALICLGIFKIFIFVSITMIYHIVWKFVSITAKRTRKSFNTNEATTSPPQYDQSIHRMALFVSISLVACYLPSIVAHFYAAYRKLSNHEDLVMFYYIETWTIVPMYINSGLNGGLFIYHNKKIRKWFLKAFLHIPYKLRRSRLKSPKNRTRRDAIIFDKDTHRNLTKLVIAIECSTL